MMASAPNPIFRIGSWWQATKGLWGDGAELWTEEVEDFLLIWTREIAVGLFITVVFSWLIGICAPKLIGMNQSSDSIMLYIQHNNEQQISILTERVSALEREALTARGEREALKTSVDDGIWYKRFIIGLLGTLLIGVAGLFAKIRMGGNRR